MLGGGHEGRPHRGASGKEEEDPRSLAVAEKEEPALGTSVRNQREEPGHRTRMWNQGVDPG